MSQFLQTRFLLYDGGCRLCRDSLAIIRYLDLLQRIVPLDATGDWSRVHARFPQIRQQDAMRDMHVVRSDGRTYRGYDAFRAIAWVLPLAWPILPLLYLPPIPQLGRRIYRRIADNRCTTASCAARPAAPDRQPTDHATSQH
ncbi:MAG TPA: DCC1-like thiol-disulfide oxidoreductase family protein [Tepidisphaeraceae bacterium]|nr:DCC1-like thiol-disulfide oxidoreductase family protein [Tepidisphaeraceae bacterium]